MTVNDFRYAIKISKNRMKGYRSDARSCQRILASIPTIIIDINEQIAYVEGLLEREEFENIKLFQYKSLEDGHIRDFNYVKTPYEIGVNSSNKHFKKILESFLKYSKECLLFFDKEEEKWREFEYMFDELANFYEIKEEEFDLLLLEKVFGEDVKKLKYYKERRDYLNFDKRMFNRFSFVLTSSDRNLLKSWEEQISNIESVPSQEKTDFISVCSLLFKFKAHVLNRGTFKSRSKVDEKDFQEEIIRFIDANENIKDREIEPEVAGGKVDLILFNIPVELKIIRNDNHLELLENTNSGQIVSYCSGRSSSLGIICFLDILEKKNAPSLLMERNRIFKAPYHGINSGEQKYPVYIGHIIIDGNTKNPSEYSK